MRLTQPPAVEWTPGVTPPQDDKVVERGWSGYPPLTDAAPLAVTVRTEGLLPEGFGRVARAVQVALGLCGVASLATVLFELWSEVMMSTATGSAAMTLGALRAYDTLVVALGGASSVLAVLAGVLWLAWQHRLASAVPRAALRRSPGWHVGSWLIPVVNLWFPFQNILDLQRAVTPRSDPRRTPARYWLWWALWLGHDLMPWVIGWISEPRVTVAAAAQAAGLNAVAEALNAGAAVLAILVVGDLTRRIVEARDEALTAADLR